MPRTILATDLFALRAVRDVDANGGRVAYSIAWPDAATDEPRSTLHLLEGGQSRPLTDGHRDTAPSFSPDGTRIAFVRAEPKGRPQPAVLTLATGVVDVVTGYEHEKVHQIGWVDDRRLVIRATRRPVELVGLDDDELERRPLVTRRLDFRFNGLGTTAHARRQVDVVDLASGTISRLTDAEIDHGAAAVSPSGESVLVTAASDHDADITGLVRVWQLPTDGSGGRLLTPAPGRWSEVGFTADGRPFAIGSQTPSSPGHARPHLLSPTDDPAVLGPHDVNASAVIGDGPRTRVADGAIFAPGIRGTTVSVDRYDDTTGELRTVAQGPFVVTSFDVLDDGAGSIVAAVTTPLRPAELWRFGPDGHEILVSLNDDLLAELDLAPPERVSVPSTNGATVEALLVRPPDSVRATEPGPGLVYIHGGPMSAYTESFFDEFQMAAADGYTVIAGNPRGSDGYGEAWLGAITGDLGNKDWDDIQALTDHLAGLDTVDADRIGIGGGSYGGFLTSWAISHSDRYRAALVERAVTNWETMAGCSDIGSWFLPFLLDADWHTGLDTLRRLSPMTYADDITTPTLIVHSEEDWRCSIEQAEQLFAALRRNGVDVTLARFPGENHELSRSGSPRHRVERLRLVHDFFAEHLLDRPSRI